MKYEYSPIEGAPELRVYGHDARQGHSDLNTRGIGVNEFGGRTTRGSYLEITTGMSGGVNEIRVNEIRGKFNVSVDFPRFVRFDHACDLGVARRV